MTRKSGAVDGAGQKEGEKDAFGSGRMTCRGTAAHVMHCPRATPVDLGFAAAGPGAVSSMSPPLFVPPPPLCNSYALVQATAGQQRTAEMCIFCGEEWNVCATANHCSSPVPMAAPPGASHAIVSMTREGRGGGVRFTTTFDVGEGVLDHHRRQAAVPGIVPVPLAGRPRRLVRCWRVKAQCR